MVKSPEVNSRIGRVTHWRSRASGPGSQAPPVCFFGGRPPGGTETRRAFAATNEAEDQVPPGAGIDPKRVTGQAREKPGRQLHHGTHRRSVADWDDSACRSVAETSLRHHGEDGPAKSATCVEPLRLGTSVALKLCGGILAAEFETRNRTRRIPRSAK